MTVSAKTLIPCGIEYSANVASGIQLPAGAFFGSTNGVQNDWLIHFSTPRPCGLSAANSRHTVAMDLKFEGGYLANGSCHGGVISRHTGQDYKNVGDNRSGAIIFGAYYENTGMVATEEIQIKDDFDNILHKVRPDLLIEGQWYRVAVDTIYKDGAVGIKARVWDLVTGELIYVLPTTWSEYSANWRYGQHASVFSVGGATNNTEGFKFTNMKIYWSKAKKAIKKP